MISSVNSKTHAKILKYYTPTTDIEKRMKYEEAKQKYNNLVLNRHFKTYATKLNIRNNVKNKRHFTIMPESDYKLRSLEQKNNAKKVSVSEHTVTHKSNPYCIGNLKSGYKLKMNKKSRSKELAT